MNGIATCTFCGEQPQVRVFDGWAKVECDCGACGPAFGDENVPRRRNELAAMAAWNILIGVPVQQKRPRTSVTGRNYVLHLDRGGGRTYCGRLCASVNCAAFGHDETEEQTCQQCVRLKNGH